MSGINNAAEGDIRPCARCNTSAKDFIEVDTGLKIALQTVSDVSSLPKEICGNCYKELTAQVSKGVRLRLEQQAKEKNRHMLWKSRVNLVKHARTLMTQKHYAEAAVAYEKYLKVLEIAYDLKPGELSPKVFGNSSKSKELTVIATTYWDLFRIYDTSPNYRERMTSSAKKLAEFVPFSPAFPDIAKKAILMVKTSKNPDIVRNFLRDTKTSYGGCFIATAVLDENDPALEDLRSFRDDCLSTTRLGRHLIFLYYMNSPRIAKTCGESPLLAKGLRPIVKGAAFLVSKSS